MRWKFVLALAMAIGGSFVACLCGGPGAHGGCSACEEAKAALGAKEGGAETGCPLADAGSGADAADAGPD